jgi:uncharacterized protein (DUF4415 family)
MAAKSRSLAPSKASGAGSSRRAAHGGTSDADITLVSRDDQRPGKTDWNAVDALTDEEIESAAMGDPDAVPLDVDWSEAVLFVPPKKRAISIRVDEDVLKFFRQSGSGYQSRINAVLRSYVQAKGKKR